MNLPPGTSHDLDELVGAAGGQHLAVRAEADAEHRVAVAVLDVGDELAAGHVEDLDLAVLGRGAAAGGQQLAVGREGQGDDAVGEAGRRCA